MICTTEMIIPCRDVAGFEMAAEEYDQNVKNCRDALDRAVAERKVCRCLLYALL